MQDKSTGIGDAGAAATGLKTGTIMNKVGTVLFNENDLLGFTKKAVNVLGIDFDNLEGTQKEAFVAQAIGCLTGVPPTKVAEFYGKTDPAVTIEFRKLVLQEAKNSPSWDQDEFIQGYVYNGPISKGITGSGTTRKEELEHSTR